MRFQIDQAIEILTATPATLSALLGNVSDEWACSSSDSPQLQSDGPVKEIRDPKTEIPDRSWTAFDVVGHLIHGEETDWIPRARIILAQGENRTFVPFDRFAQFERSKGKSLAVLLAEFERLRSDNIDELHSWELTDVQLALEGVHPELGLVTLRQLLATWVVHDLNHIRQIATSMAKKYDGEVGVWKEYLSILK